MEGENISLLQEGTNFVCQKNSYSLFGFMKDHKGRIASILKDSNGKEVVLQCVDYVMYKKDGMFKSIAIKPIEYAVHKNVRFLLYIHREKKIIEIDPIRIKNECEEEKRYFRGINMYFINLREYEKT
jgi:hypothetical protein